MVLALGISGGVALTFRVFCCVRAVVPKEKLLELERGSGYEAICKFLDKPIPKNEIYPHINPPDNIIKGHTRLWWYTVAVTGMKIGRYLKFEENIMNI